MKNFIFHICFVLLFFTTFFNCSKDNTNTEVEVTKCWLVLEANTNKPIENATIYITYNFDDSTLGPFGKWPITNKEGSACEDFPKGTVFYTVAAWAPGYSTSKVEIDNTFYLSPP